MIDWSLGEGGRFGVYGVQLKTLSYMVKFSENSSKSLINEADFIGCTLLYKTLEKIFLD